MVCLLVVFPTISAIIECCFTGVYDATVCTVCISTLLIKRNNNSKLYWVSLLAPGKTANEIYGIIHHE